MNTLPFHLPKSQPTPFVTLDTSRCKACWACLTTCPARVIGKIDLPWHKHAVIRAGNRCTGCNRCVTACLHGAMTPAVRAMTFTSLATEGKDGNGAKKSPRGTARDVNGTPAGGRIARRKPYGRLMTNGLLLISGLIMAFSGLLLQAGYHMAGAGPSGGDLAGNGNPGHQVSVRTIDVDRTVLRLCYRQWSATHKVSMVIFLLSMITHLYVHRQWYGAVIKRRKFTANRQVLLLTLLFALAAFTGLTPWCIGLAGGSEKLRIGFIEIHDKLTLLLLVFLFLHTCNRARWFLQVLTNHGK